MIAYAAAALGGALGALIRWSIAEGLPHEPGGWPWATLLVNLTGCLVLGLLLALVFARAPDHPWLRPFLGTGVLGGFTTYSAFAVEVVQQADGGAWGLAVGYIATSVLGGVAASAVGLALGRAAVTPRPSVAAVADAEEDVA